MSIAETLSYRRRQLRAASIYSRHVKRLLDLGLVLLVLPVTLPVILLLAVLVRRDGGPAFFGHERVGRHGASFRCWKLRSMADNAKELLERHLERDPAAAEEWKAHQKLSDDPRVTRLGRLLRATSLDELPQLWNVVRGEMSLVGPRPVTRAELDRYQGSEGYYLAARPGVTGLWQVSGRNDVSYPERVRLDVRYVKTCSFAVDVMILVRTIGAVLRRSGR
ncbi:sugar transferase [Rubellimicrobium rubrum]|uniref:Sugar transferase n=1 Tax=Rubellimicrobium rubrum TaxID=2585369 RepID=A0A5C4MTR4_9RHOB|nr:sugar transferase [Rubellimicrobium rubrum]TNC47740.1 sugar transferase [Rubellimicrobium rubrum]